MGTGGGGGNGKGNEKRRVRARGSGNGKGSNMGHENKICLGQKEEMRVGEERGVGVGVTRSGSDGE